MEAERLRALLVAGLEELKAENIQILDVRRMTSITDTMVIACGRSSRQVRALAERVLEEARGQGLRPLGVEGLEDAEWVLVDLGDAVAHIMQPEARDYYQLEKLWAQDPETTEYNATDGREVGGKI